MAEITEVKTKIRGVSRVDPRSGMERQAIIRRYLRPGTVLELHTEPGNPVNPKAIAVWLRRKRLLGSRTFHLGYLGENLSYLHGRIGEGRIESVVVSSITGGTREKPTRGVNVVIRWLDLERR